MCFETSSLIDLDLCEQSGSNGPIAVQNVYFSYDVTSGSEIKPCNKIDKPPVVCRFSGYVMKYGKSLTVSRQKYDFKIILISYDRYNLTFVYY